MSGAATRRTVLSALGGTLGGSLGGALGASLAGCGKPAEITGGFTGAGAARGHLLRAPRAALPPPAVTRRVQVLIAGGGVAGLAAARALRLRGIDDFALLELENDAGGNSRGGTIAGVACPLGAHYLPVPGDDAREVQDLLEELGLRRRVAGRWQYDERHLCHSPQERLFFNGEWQEGLLPMQDVGAATLAQYRRFGARVAQLQRESRFAMPAFRAPFTDRHAALDAITFARWLAHEGLDDRHLRWYLDYCCRDDYGAGAAVVSAWAGIHYFASRHGFHAPGDGDAAGEPVLTWPEGNAWLTRRLAAPLGERLRTGRTVLRIAEDRHGVQVDAFDHGSQAVERWQAARCIVALPLFVAVRVVDNPPEVLRAAAARTGHAPWLVANVHLRGPLADRPGAPPSWDNVLYGAGAVGTGGLGYVDAAHQRLDPRPGPTVLTWYRPLGGEPGARQVLLDRPWTAWRDALLAELSVPHPDLAGLTTRIELTRHGHAMALPVPGIASQNRLRGASGLPGVLLKEEQGAVFRTRRMAFAHGDWAGYSVFEEAFARGHIAGAQIPAGHLL